MEPSGKFNADVAGRSERVVFADALWIEASALLKAAEVEMPQTPRRPDVRLIVDNISGKAQEFLNPGNHSASKPEIIPAEGGSTAAMVMVAGVTLQDQYANAKDLFQRYQLGKKGLSDEFVSDLKNNKLSNSVTEAYGPAPFGGQATKLVPVEWQDAPEAGKIEIVPVIGPAAAFGARAATQETAFLLDFRGSDSPVSVKGTNTTPEQAEGGQMAVAVSGDWKTGEVSTRPIVPSVARGFYGSHYESIPVVTVDGDGQVVQVSIKGREPIVAAASLPAKKVNAPSPSP